MTVPAPKAGNPGTGIRDSIFVKLLWIYLGTVLVVVALTQPLAGWVFVLDGVLIGAGDGRYLAVAGLWTLVAFLPLAGLVLVASVSGTSGLMWLWVAFAGGFMLARAVTLTIRARGNAWLVLGAAR